MTGSRADVASSFTVIKGAMIDETFSVLLGWDLARTKRDNLDRLRRENFIGAKSETWLRDVAKVFNRRFDPEGRDRALVVLAKAGCDLEVWKPLMLWHMTRDEFLLRDFLIEWLFPAYESGAHHLKPAELRDYLTTVGKRGGKTEHSWQESTIQRVAAGLLKTAADFGLLQGTVAKEFASYHLPERSFVYLLHAMRAETKSPQRVLDSPDWRMFLMRRSDVERELLRLHQFRTVEYQAAGSIVELTLPCASAVDYAARMVT